MRCCTFFCYSLATPPHTFIIYFFFFFNDTATTEIYTLSLHDALPISARFEVPSVPLTVSASAGLAVRASSPLGLSAYELEDRKSTRLNSSHVEISYAVFCLKKKKKML